VNSVEKALGVLYAFGETRRALGLTEIAERSGLSMGAAQRFTHTFQVLGLLSKDPKSRRYRLTPRLLDLSLLYQRASGLAEIATPHLVRLGEESEETVQLVERDGAEVVYVTRLPRRQVRNPAAVVGARMPAFCTSSGRAMLARLPEQEAAALLAASDLKPLTPRTATDPAALMAQLALARHHGYSIIDRECWMSEISVAAPILDYSGTPVAAVGIPLSARRWSAAEVEESLAPLVCETARAISRALGAAEAFAES
jgi:DNA-binding IclR family transcriptional regulator